MNAHRAASFVHAADSTLSVVENWPRLPAGFALQRVSGVAVDSRGVVYVAHRGENPLLCFRSDGSLLREVGAVLQRKTVGYDLRGETPVPMETRHWLHGLHIDPWDNVWVTDVGRHLVMKYDPEGNLLMTLGVEGETGCDERHFYQPTHVCVLPSGEFFVTDGYGNSRVVKFTAAGERLLEWGCRGTAPGEFHTPHVITRGLDGRLYVSDRENDRVQIFDENGRLLKVWPGLHSVDGLHAAADGFIYGAAGLDNALVRFAPTGEAVAVWSEPGFFRYPHGIGVGADGAIYAAEIAGDRVLKLRETPR